jgi:hypothetical protein
VNRQSKAHTANVRIADVRIADALADEDDSAA